MDGWYLDMKHFSVGVKFPSCCCSNPPRIYHCWSGYHSSNLSWLVTQVHQDRFRSSLRSHFYNQMELELDQAGPVMEPYWNHPPVMALQVIGIRSRAHVRTRIGSRFPKSFENWNWIEIFFLIRFQI
jgi:hypothetical protein